MTKKRVTPAVWRERITEHLTTYGDDKWELFPWINDISYANLRRYVRALLGAPVNKKSKQTKPIMVRPSSRDMQEAIDQEAREAGGEHDPIQLMTHVNKMLHICNMLDDDAIDWENQVVKNAQNAREAVKTRWQVLNMAINAQEKMYGATRIQMIHRLMMDAIKQESPEAASNILYNLRQIDREYGLALL